MELRNQPPSSHPLTAPVHPPERVTGPLELHHSEGRYPVLLPPAVVGRLRHLDDTADLRNGLALGDQLIGGFELADGLLRCVPVAFHVRVPGLVWG